jgi:uncharacterized protein (TIGR03382 family)
MSETSNDDGRRGGPRRRVLPTWARIALGVVVGLALIAGLAAALGWDSAGAGSGATAAFAIVAVVAVTRRRRGGSTRG